MRLDYPPELPVSAARDRIARALREHQVVVVAGATGSGKTTQLPKIALETGRRKIAHTQPRRIAARAVAERIAEECGVELGREVGFQVRFTKQSSASTKVKVLTDGVLLAEISRDPRLERYDCIIIDEAHERSLTIDFLLGYLHRLRAERPELQIIITSATIDPQSFAAHFANASGVPAPIIDVEGRSYPVEIRYRPLVADRIGADGDVDQADDEGASAQDRDYLSGIIDALDELDGEEPGDVLVFLSGENEIRDASEAVRGHYADRPAGYGSTEVLPLFGRLSAAEQHRVFERSRPAGTRRRIVLASNVAETSITVPGIRYVIDVGLARISRYSARSRVQRLPIEPISQASATQRAGRAGRTAPGIAIRLYSESDFAARSEFTDPEIRRTGLAAVLLRMADLGLGDIAEFPFLTPPDKREVTAATELLRELGALRASSNSAALSLTSIGRTLAHIPLEPRFARMLVESKRFGVSREVLAIVTGLTIQDPRERPIEQREQANSSHARFADPTSDLLSLLGLWNYLEQLSGELSGSQFRKRCRKEFLNYVRVREWQDLYRQIARTLPEVGIPIGEPSANPAGVHRSMLAGLLSQLGSRIERETRAASKPGKSAQGSKRKRAGAEFAGSRGRTFVVWPGSVLAKSPPEALMASELVETSRLFARGVAAIDLAWAESAAGDLALRSYSEPRWDAKSGSAVVDEKVTLFGLVIVPKRRKQLGNVQPELARELFVRHALVLGEWQLDRLDRSLTAFVRRNASLLAESVARAHERRERPPADESWLLEWFLERIPAQVTDVRHFERWWREQLAVEPKRLDLPRAALLPERELAERAGFPKSIELAGELIPVRYRHAPGQDDDGVSLLLTPEQALRIDPPGLDRIAPGLRTELITAMLKALPKPLRREVVPAAAWAERLIPELNFAEAPLVEELAAAIKRVTFAPVSASDFELERVPEHLRLRFVIVDERKKRIAASRDLAALRADLRPRFAASATLVASEGAGPTTQPGSEVAAELAGVDPELWAQRRIALIEALVESTPDPTDYLLEAASATEKLLLAGSGYPSPRELLRDLLRARADAVLAEASELTPALEATFAANLIDESFAELGVLVRALERARRIRADITELSSSNPQLLAALSDAKTQLESLLAHGVLPALGRGNLAALDRYLRALERRLELLARESGKDAARLHELREAQSAFADAGGRVPAAWPAQPGSRQAALAALRWQLEEFRVSLWAHDLGTPAPVSLQRIRKAIAALPDAAARA